MPGGGESGPAPSGCPEARPKMTEKVPPPPHPPNHLSVAGGREGEAVCPSTFRRGRPVRPSRATQVRRRSKGCTRGGNLGPSSALLGVCVELRLPL